MSHLVGSGESFKHLVRLPEQNGEEKTLLHTCVISDITVHGHHVLRHLNLLPVGKDLTLSSSPFLVE